VAWAEALSEDFATDPAGTGVFRTMKRMKMLPMLGVLGWLGLAMPMMLGQSAAADPLAAPEGRPANVKRNQGFPVFNVRVQGEWTIGELVRYVRAEVSKDKTAQTVNIVLGPGVAELKAPADLDLVNVTPMGVFAAIASVEPRLSFAPVSTPGSEMTIALQLRPNSKGQDSTKDIKLRIFRLPPPPKTLEADADKARKQQADWLDMLHSNVKELMSTAAVLRREAGGDGTSKSFQFQVHSPTRTVLVTGTAEDLDLAQEVLTSLGATPSSGSGRPEDPTAKPVRQF
jgi:hypothetical protein